MSIKPSSSKAPVAPESKAESDKRNPQKSKLKDRQGKTLKKK
jgi:hypothetical protein